MEILRHALGFCGEGHPNLLLLLSLGTTLCLGIKVYWDRFKQITRGSKKPSLEAPGSEITPLEVFNHLRISGAFIVTLVEGSESSIRMEGSEKALSKVLIDAGDGWLDISQEQDHVREDIRLYITNPLVDNIDLSGAVKFQALALRGGSLGINVSGACKVILQGQVQEVAFDCSGASLIQASKLCTQETVLDVSGASKVYLGPVLDLEIDASGACKVEYPKGQIRDLNLNISGPCKVQGV